MAPSPAASSFCSTKRRDWARCRSSKPPATPAANTASPAFALSIGRADHSAVGERGLDAWYEAVSWRGYAAIKDIDTARELSATIGQYDVLGWTEGDNTRSHSKAFEAGSRSRSSSMTYQEISRPLMRPEEIMQDLPEDEMIVVPK
jgi:TraM recognition site of TraD and TraG